MQRSASLDVLHVTASMSPEWGGPVPSVGSLVSALRQLGVRCEIATATGRRVGRDLVRAPGVPLHAFETGTLSRGWTGHSRPLTRFLDDEIPRFDVVHAHELWHHPGYAAFRAAKRHGVPFVQAFHGALDAWRLRRKWLRKRVYRWVVQDRILRSASALHVLNSFEEARVRALGYPTRTFCAPNGAEVAPLDREAEVSAFLGRYPQLDGKQIVLFLGRLHPMKGLDLLAPAFAATARRFEDAALLVCGPDETGMRPGLESAFRRAGVADRVAFAGMVVGEEKRAALRSADLFVLPSYSEGFSTAVLEAMAAGLPVVITTGCHFDEVAGHHAGLVVEAASEAVSGAMEALLADPGLRRRMGANARRLVTERYSWERAAKTTLKMYRALTAGPPG